MTEPRPTLRQALTILGGSAAVAAFGCAGFLVTGNSIESGGAMVGGLVFILGVLAFLVGWVLLLFVGIRALFRRRGATAQEAPSTPSSSTPIDHD